MNKKQSVLLIILCTLLALICFSTLILFLVVLNMNTTAKSSSCEIATNEQIETIRYWVKDNNPYNDIGVSFSMNWREKLDGNLVATYILTPDGNEEDPLIGIWFLSEPAYMMSMNSIASKYTLGLTSSEASSAVSEIEILEQCVLEYINQNPTANTKAPEIQENYLYRIPELSYDDINTHLRQLGISCEPNKPVTESHLKDCHGDFDNGSVQVDVEIISAEEPDDIYHILACVNQFEDTPSYQKSAEILGRIAFLNYYGASPKEASEWVYKNISSTNSETSSEKYNKFFGNVLFHVGPNPLITCLFIGRADSQTYP